jgi:hypothetical protein
MTAAPAVTSESAQLKTRMSRKFFFIKRSPEKLEFVESIG